MRDKKRASTNGERGGSGERMSLSWWSSSWAPRQAPRRWQRRGAGKSPCLGSSPCPCGRTAPTPFFFRRLRGQGGEHTVKQRRPRQRSERTSGLEPDLAGDSWQVPHRAERGWPAPPRKPVQPRYPPRRKRPHIPLHARQRTTTTLLAPPTSTADKNKKKTQHSSTSARAAPPPIPRRLRRRIQQRAAAAVADAPPCILPDALHRG